MFQSGQIVSVKRGKRFVPATVIVDRGRNELCVELWEIVEKSLVNRYCVSSMWVGRENVAAIDA